MTKPNRETIILSAIASSIGALIVALILLSFTSVGDTKKDFYNKLDGKVDKVDYKEKCLSIQEEIDGKISEKRFMQHKEEESRSFQILLDEIRLNRQEIKEIRK